MKYLLSVVVLSLVLVWPAEAQITKTESLLESLARLYASGNQPASDDDGTYLGRLSENPYLPDSIANPYGRFGNRYAPDSLNNRHGRYGSRYSPYSSKNPYAVRTPKLFGADGTYLGKLSDNRYDPESIANPYGRYGSRYSPDSVNNPYGRFGNPFSPDSATNPYALTPPSIFADDSP